MATSLLSKGINLYREGQIKNANKLFQGAVRQSPGSAVAWLWLGKSTDDIEKKHDLFNHALQLDPALKTKIPPLDRDDPEKLFLAMQNLELESELALPNKKRWSLLISGLVGICLVITCTSVIFLSFDQGISYQTGQIFNVIKSVFFPENNNDLQQVTVRLIATGSDHGVTIPIEIDTATPTPESYSSNDPIHLIQTLSFEATEARLVSLTTNYDQCIEYYDKILKDLPNWPTGYLDRSICKRKKAQKSNNAELYKEGVLDAIKDVDKAIEIGPVDGYYFIERSYDFTDIRNVVENATSERELLQIALDNIRTGIRLGVDDPDSLVMEPTTLIEMGRCEEGLAIAKRQLFDYDQTPIPLLESIAEGDLCLGNYDQAKKDIENVFSYVNDSSSDIALEAAILIGLGKPDNAYRVVDESIKNNPNFGGHRYYLRALINWDRGEKEAAINDLQIGSGNTWFHGGIYAYIVGLYAIENGDTENGIEYLKYAESTIHVHQEGPWLKERIRKRLAELQIEEQTPTPVMKIQSTPIQFEKITPIFSTNP
jgi:tetratricopeptide (TPR) repeat protein